MLIMLINRQPNIGLLPSLPGSMSRGSAGVAPGQARELMMLRITCMSNAGLSASHTQDNEQLPRRRGSKSQASGGVGPPLAWELSNMKRLLRSMIGAAFYCYSEYTVCLFSGNGIEALRCHAFVTVVAPFGVFFGSNEKLFSFFGELLEQRGVTHFTTQEALE